MKFMSTIVASAFTFIFVSHQPLNGEEVIYRTPSGEVSALEIESERSFAEVINRIQCQIDSDEERVYNEITLKNLNSKVYLLDFMVANNHCTHDLYSSGYSDSYSCNETVYAKGSVARNYNALLLPEEQKEISYVIETVGNSSLYSIAREKSTIKRSGKLVEHVHPLKFLAYIFSSEKLKASLHNVRGRSWVWGQFFKGLKNSFDEESERNNILPHIKDFTQRVGVDTKTFYSLAENRRWKEFLDALLKEIPKSENSGRYDM